MRSIIWMLLVARAVAETGSAVAEEAFPWRAHQANCFAGTLSEAHRRNAEEEFAEAYWRRLTRPQRKAWQNWALTNRVVLDHGHYRERRCWSYQW